MEQQHGAQEPPRTPNLEVQQHQGSSAAALQQQEGAAGGTTTSAAASAAATAAAPAAPHDEPPNEDQPAAAAQSSPQQQQPEEANEDLSLMVFYKVLPCNQNHSWNSCPYRHVGEKARRRSLLLYSYNAQICPDVRKKTGCPRGDACTLTHSMFEYHMHPQRYRTIMCKDSQDCRRPFCFFAHNAGELRLPREGLPAGLDDADELSGLCQQLAAKAAAVAADLLADANTTGATAGSSGRDTWASSGASRSPQPLPGSSQLQPGTSNILLQSAFGRLDLHGSPAGQLQYNYAPVAADTVALVECPATRHIVTSSAAAAAAAAVWPSDHTMHSLSVPVQQPFVQPWPSAGAGVHQQHQPAAFSAPQTGHGSPGLLEQAHQVVLLQQQPQPPLPWLLPLPQQQVLQHQAQQQLALPLVVSPQQQELQLQLPSVLQPQAPPPHPQQHVFGVQQQQQPQQQWMLLAVPASAGLAAGSTSHTSSSMQELVYVMRPQPMAAENSATGQPCWL